jgi:hypothetical protein
MFLFKKTIMIITNKVIKKFMAIHYGNQFVINELFQIDKLLNWNKFLFFLVPFIRCRLF